MKLVTFSHSRATRLGALVAQNENTWVIDLNRAEPRLPDDLIALLNAGDAAMQIARQTAARADKRFWLSEKDVTLLAPLPRPGKIICVGHNYRDHTGATPPAFPDIFAKFTNVVIGPDQPIRIPRVSAHIDYEAELAVVIGRRARYVTQDRAMDVIAGYTIFNDVTARDFQKRVSQWTLGKTFDTFGPLGPALVTADEIPDPGSLDLSLSVNGELRQRANTRDLLFTIPFLISYLSDVMTLEPGDLISTGTPSGTGSSRKPPVFLQAGDEIAIRVEKIGELRNPVSAENV